MSDELSIAKARIAELEGALRAALALTSPADAFCSDVAYQPNGDELLEATAEANDIIARALGVSHGECESCGKRCYRSDWVSDADWPGVRYCPDCADHLRKREVSA